jgi:hypothetical protein
MISWPSTVSAEEQVEMAKKNVTVYSEFKSRFVDPEIYIPPFDFNESTFKNKSSSTDFKGTIPSLMTSEERSTYLSKLDAIRLEIEKEDEFKKYLYPMGPIIGYGFNINGTFEVTYYENSSFEKNTTDEIYNLITNKAETYGIQSIPVLFEQKTFLKPTSSPEPGYDVRYRPLVGGIQVKTSFDNGSTITTSTLGFTAINENYEKGYVVAGHAASEMGMLVCQPYYSEYPNSIYKIGTVDVIGTPEGLFGWLEADASFVEYEDISPQIHIGNEVLRYVYGYQDPTLGMEVYKSGRSTGVTSGEVTKVRNDYVYLPDGAFLHNQTYADFHAEKKDSGSPVYFINEENQKIIVGIVSSKDILGDMVISPVSVSRKNWVWFPIQFTM